jgi:hypothetical protein
MARGPQRQQWREGVVYEKVRVHFAHGEKL